jgi:hypothetical protein
VDVPRAQGPRDSTFDELGAAIRSVDDGVPVGPKPSYQPPRWPRPAAVVAVALVAAVLLVTLDPFRSSRAIADPAKAGQAAVEAGTFAFRTESELNAGRRLVRKTVVDGEVSFPQSAIRTTIRDDRTGKGYERILTRRAVFSRALTGPASMHWLGAGLKHEAHIGPAGASGGGLGDPIALFALLAQIRSRPLGTTIYHHKPAQLYAAATTVGEIARIEHGHVTRAQAAIPVTLKIWQTADSRLVHVKRTFSLHRGLALIISTDFNSYGRPTHIDPEPVTPVRHQDLAPFADDPLGEQAISLLLLGTTNP